MLSHCEQWRQNLWRTIRHHHLLPYQGFPIFFSNWTANPAPAPGLPTAPNSPFPTNWVALYAPGVAAVHQGQDAALHAALLAAGVPQERVVVLEPTAKLHQSKQHEATAPHQRFPSSLAFNLWSKSVSGPRLHRGAVRKHVRSK